MKSARKCVFERLQDACVNVREYGEKIRSRKRAFLQEFAHIDSKVLLSEYLAE
jgi:hypothetical protein